MTEEHDEDAQERPYIFGPGETVAVTDDNESGEVTTEYWPEAVPSADELTDKQREIIATAADPRTMFTSFSKLGAAAGASRSYTSDTLEKFWIEKYRGIRKRKYTGVEDETEGVQAPSAQSSSEEPPAPEPRPQEVDSNGDSAETIAVCGECPGYWADPDGLWDYCPKCGSELVFLDEISQTETGGDGE